MHTTLASLLLGPLALAATVGPLATIKQVNGDVDKLLRDMPKEGTPAEKQKKEKITDLAASLLDYGELAKKSLGDHWTQFTQPQRDEFVKTFRELIEKHYVKQLKKNLASLKLNRLGLSRADWNGASDDYLSRNLKGAGLCILR